MQAIKQLYKVGYGPSSSHTIAPYRFVSLYREYHPDCNRYAVTLCGSLALTGKGHSTDSIIKKGLNCDEVSFSYDVNTQENLIVIQGYNNNYPMDIWHGYSLGGGAISIDEIHVSDQDEVYSENSFDEIKNYLYSNNISLLDYVYSHEPDLKSHLDFCLSVIYQSIESGLKAEGILNEQLHYSYVAKQLFKKAKTDRDYLMAYSYAACEQNAAGNLMVTAPTLGACGILSALMYFLHHNKGIDNNKLCDLLAIAGVFGNCIKQNASIAGSIGGCQAEIGTACSMASAAIAYLEGCELHTIEYAAEMGIEHFLGLTCDPVLGYVIIPCIERNAVSVLRAYDCAYLASQFKDIKKNVISFDSVVKTMNYTGSKIAVELRETSLGGLSKEYVG